MPLLPPPTDADLAFVTITTTGIATYSGRTGRTLRPAWHYWQFMFTLEGEGAGEIAGRPLRAHPGSVWLLPKDVPHHYERHPSAPRWRYRWIEIDGHAVPALLRMLGFDRQPWVHGCAAIDGRIAEVLAALEDPSPSNRHRATALFLQVLAEVAAQRADAAGPPSPTSRLAARIQRLLVQHVQQPISLEELAARLDVTPAHLIRCFRHEHGMSPMRYLTKLRVNHAQRLLAAGSGSISEIGAAIGYAKVQHFSRMFRRETGMSPRAYQRGLSRSG